MALTDKQIIAFKIGARAKKLGNEDCIVEGYELLYAATRESQENGDLEMVELLKFQTAKYEEKFINLD